VTTRLPSGVTGRPWFWPAVIFAVALAVRLVYVAEVRHTPFFQTLGLDAKFYDQWARDILTGQAHPGAFFMTPLYSYFLAGVYWLFGRDLLLVRVVQAVIGSLSAALTCGIGREAFGRRVGVASGLVAACYGALVFYDGAVLLEPLLVLLVTLSLYLLLVAERSPRSRLLHMLAGCALGAASVGRAAALLLVPAAAGWAAAAVRKGAARRWAPAALVVAGAVLVVAPVTVRNYVASGDFVAITSNGGINFYIGNSAAATGGYVKPAGLDIVSDPDGRAIAERALGRGLRPSEVSAYWYGLATRFISEHPGKWLSLLVRKLSFALSSYEIPQLENYYFQKGYSRLLSLPLPGFAVVGPLGLLGLAMALRRRGAALLGLFLAVYVASVVAFFVVARYRLPVVPPLIAGACHAVFELAARARARRWRAFLAPAAALAALAFLVNANLWGVDRGTAFAQSHFRVGIILGERGLTEEAIAEYRRAIEIDPAYPQSHLNLGALLAEQGRTEEAVAAFRRALTLDPRLAAARLNLAMALKASGDAEAALAQIDTLLAGHPADAAALKERGIVLHGMGRDQEALAALREAARVDSAGTESAEVAFYVGMIEGRGGGELTPGARLAMAEADSLSRAGRAKEAVSALERAAALAPRSGAPLLRLAALERDLGLGEQALTTATRALDVDPAVAHGHFARGVLLSDLGRHDEAMLEYEAETRLFPDFAPAHLNLAITHRFHTANSNLAAYHYRRYLALGGEPIPDMEGFLRELGSWRG